MRLGYFRIRPDTANSPDLSELEAARCDQLVVDAAPGQFSKVLAAQAARLGQGDELVVVRLVHLTAMPALLGFCCELIERGVVIESLSDGLRSDSEGVASTIKVFAHYQSQPQISDVRPPGRPLTLSRDDLERARKLLSLGQTMGNVAKELGVSRTTLFRRLRSG